MSLPEGGLMEMLLGGKSPSENQQKVDGLQQGRQNATEQINQAVDSSKTDQQKI